MRFRHLSLLWVALVLVVSLLVFLFLLLVGNLGLKAVAAARLVSLLILLVFMMMSFYKKATPNFGIMLMLLIFPIFVVMVAMSGGCKVFRMRSLGNRNNFRDTLTTWGNHLPHPESHQENRMLINLRFNSRCYSTVYLQEPRHFLNNSASCHIWLKNLQ